MNLQTVGKNTLDVEVNHISTHGIWLLTENQEFFMPCDEFILKSILVIVFSLLQFKIEYPKFVYTLAKG